MATLHHAILHFDGDSFFASVEQALNHELRGKPVVTGGERGAVTSLSYEAKRLGLRRSMTMREVKAVCPQAIIVPSDYMSYSIYAHRMYSLVRRFTPIVEEYSIDECFADITGLDESSGKSYEEIAREIKRALEGALGITFGVGLGPNKLLAKTASKYRKPAGFTVITPDTAPEYLEGMPVGSLWGVGGSMSQYLRRFGVNDALSFAQKGSEWVEDVRLSKPYRQMWLELQGYFVNPVASQRSDDVGSLMTTRTFSPPSRDRGFIFSQLSKNIERACLKARNHRVRAREITFGLKTQEFTHHRIEMVLPKATSDPAEIIAAVATRFDELYVPRIEYRATGITLRSLVRTEAGFNIFGESIQSTATKPLLDAVDSINKTYGRETVFHASSMRALQHTDRHYQPLTLRPHEIRALSGKRKKVIELPFLGEAK